MGPPLEHSPQKKNLGTKSDIFVDPPALFLFLLFLISSNDGPTAWHHLKKSKIKKKNKGPPLEEVKINK